MPLPSASSPIVLFSPPAITLSVAFDSMAFPLPPPMPLPEAPPPIVLRDYAVFLPSREVPPTALQAVAERMARGLPAPSPWLLAGLTTRH